MNYSERCLVPLQGTGTNELCNKQEKPQINKMRHTQAYGLPSLKLPGDRLLATFVNQMVASAFDLPSEKLLRYERGNANAARARQISIYLMHTVLSFPLSKISRIYNKDRTTIGHACRVVEDLRDGSSFDCRILELEQTIATVLKLASHVPQKGGRDAR